MAEYTVVLAPNEGSDIWTATCPAMPGCTSQGPGREGAIRSVLEAMELWLEVTREDGQDALPETPGLIADEVAFVLGWKAEEGWPLVVETTRVVLREPVAA
jgi:predicted RNase H-like HicB family nuclease